MPSRATARARRRTASGDDIPLAKRRTPLGPGSGSASRLRLALPVALVVAVSTSALLIGPLRPWLLPPPVPGLKARLSADGRLLGHFPYPEAPAAALVAIAPGLQLRPDAARSLEAMRRAAAEQGVELEVISAFRSAALQRQLFFGVSAERNQSVSSRARVSAPPGHSEHSTGFAVDLGDARQPASHLSERFESTDAFAWLVANAARFHFQLSFPRGNRQGVSYEPWHWRYEGSTEALRLFDAAHRFAR